MATEQVWQLGKEEIVAGDEKILEFNMVNEYGGAIDLSGSTFSFILTPIGENYTPVLNKTGETDGITVITEYDELGVVISCIVKVNLFYSDTINLEGQHIMYVKVIDSDDKQHSAMGYLTIFASPTV